MTPTPSELTRRHTETFECLTCANGQLFETRPDFCKHLSTVHGVEPARGSRKKVFHMDAATRCISTYECVIRTVKFFLTINTERTEAFRMRQQNAA